MCEEVKKDPNLPTYEDNNTTTPNVEWHNWPLPTKWPTVCPHCGRCPTCGRGGGYDPYKWYPTTYPPVIYTTNNGSGRDWM